MVENSVTLNDLVATEFSGVTTVADVRRALEGLADDLPVTDAMGSPLMISVVCPLDLAVPTYVEVA